MSLQGLHLAKYYAPGHWGERLNAEELAKLFVADIEQGIDSADYNGPEISRTPHKAGVVKVATGANSPSARERKAFEAAAIAHQQTGAPILTHTEQGAGALEQVRLFEEFGVPLQHVVISHTDRARRSRLPQGDSFDRRHSGIRFRVSLGSRSRQSYLGSGRRDGSCRVRPADCAWHGRRSPKILESIRRRSRIGISAPRFRSAINRSRPDQSRH